MGNPDRIVYRRLLTLSGNSIIEVNLPEAAIQN